MFIWIPSSHKPQTKVGGIERRCDFASLYITAHIIYEPSASRNNPIPRRMKPRCSFLHFSSFFSVRPRYTRPIMTKSGNMKTRLYNNSNGIPVAPKKALIYLVAFALGILIPLGIIYFPLRLPWE